jgi:glutathione synthase/RimK-type ligase-like ATP-grasp enzyme
LPCIFQENIEKRKEYRVTVVGDEVFSASVDSQSNEMTQIDWRRKKLKFRANILPKEIENLCIKLLMELGISFGALDLIETTKGDFYFLEINPNGQWAWIEIDTGLKISDSIIKFLK